ncbi:MAG: 30S ribosomal protein S9 [Nanoarchaeota archaeon]|nr:30S ribosomal protein S9 [Nanoarchaeota archaeon]MEC8339121.1 30S ribosomal protein S9 [Nanoarchaeota archaeon]
MAGKNNSVLTSGFRKTSVARASLVKGSGNFKINNQSVEEFNNNTLLQLKVKEPLIISGLESKYDIKVTVFGGGVNSQVDAIRQAIARGLVEISGSEELKKQFVEYDRALIVSDTRFKETKKPNNSNARASRQKSYR